MIIDQLPNGAPFSASDEVAIEKGQTTYKGTLAQLLDAIKPGIVTPFVNFGAKIGSDITGPGQSATPSQNCLCVVQMGATSGTAATVSIDGVLVASTLIQTSASATYPYTVSFYVRAGQTVTTRNVTGQAYVMRFYALYNAG